MYLCQLFENQSLFVSQIRNSLLLLLVLVEDFQDLSGSVREVQGEGGGWRMGEMCVVTDGDTTLYRLDSNVLLFS